MNFGKFDITLIMMGILALVAGTFLFPALELTEQERAEIDDFPEYNISSDRFDFAGEFPEDPNTIDSGTLELDRTDVSGSSNYLDLNSSLRIILFNTSDQQLSVVNFAPDPDEQENFYFNDTPVEGYIHANDVFGYEIRFTLTDVENRGADDMHWAVEYQIHDQPSSDTWYHRIPGIGQAIQGGEQLVGVVAYFASVIYWAVAWMFTVVSNTLAMTGDITIFLITLFHWMFTTLSLVISSSSGWATIFIFLPLILLWLELVKIVALAVWIIWIG